MVPSILCRRARLPGVPPIWMMDHVALGKAGSEFEDVVDRAGIAGRGPSTHSDSQYPNLRVEARENQRVNNKVLTAAEQSLLVMLER